MKVTQMESNVTLPYINDSFLNGFLLQDMNRSTEWNLKLLELKMD